MENAATQSPQPGLIGRMIRVFYAPRETFEAVAASRTAIDWVAPAAVSAIVAFAAAVAIMPLAMEEGAQRRFRNRCRARRSATSSAR